MSEPNPEPKKALTPEEIFAQLEPLLDDAVFFAFLHHHHPPTPDNLQRARRGLWVHLWENDYQQVRSYKQQSKLVTWLQPVANNYVHDWLKEQGRYTSLEDAPPELFTQPPTQEETLLGKEREELLEKVLRTLTPHEQQLFELMRQGRKPAEIAQEMDITPKSASEESSVLKRKVGKLFKEAQERK